MNLLKINVIIIINWLNLIKYITNAGTCAETKLCCNGRDSACVVQKISPNAIIQTIDDKPCYCDHACLKLGDCCNDFKETCGGKLM